MKISLAFLFCWLAPILFVTLLFNIRIPELFISKLFGTTLVLGMLAYGMAAIFTKKGNATSIRLFFLLLVLFQVGMFANRLSAFIS